MNDKLNLKFLFNSPDYILVAQVKMGNEQAFTILYEKYFEKLLNSMKSKFSSLQYEVIEDAVLESFVVLYENIMSGKYKHDDILFSYIYRIAFYKLTKPLSIGNDDDLEYLISEVFEENEKELYFDTIEEILKDLSVGNILCKILFDAQFTQLFDVEDRKQKISDEELFANFPDAFTNVDNIRNKRNKCMEKLKKVFFEKIGGNRNE